MGLLITAIALEMIFYKLCYNQSILLYNTTFLEGAMVHTGHLILSVAIPMSVGPSTVVPSQATVFLIAAIALVSRTTFMECGIVYIGHLLMWVVVSMFAGPPTVMPSKATVLVDGEASSKTLYSLFLYFTNHPTVNLVDYS